MAKKNFKFRNMGLLTELKSINDELIINRAIDRYKKLKDDINSSDEFDKNEKWEYTKYINKKLIEVEFIEKAKT